MVHGGKQREGVQEVVDIGVFSRGLCPGNKRPIEFLAGIRVELPAVNYRLVDLLLVRHPGIFLGPRPLELEVALAHAVALLVKPFDIVRVRHGPLKKRRQGICRFSREWAYGLVFSSCIENIILFTCERST